MKRKLYIIIILLIAKYSIAQTNDFDQEKLAEIRNYKSSQLENGLTVISLQKSSSSDFFIRAYTDLPAYVSKNYQAFILVDNELRKFTGYKLPAGWKSATLNSMNIKLEKDFHGYYSTCPSESLDTTIQLFASLFQQPVIEADKIEKSKVDILAETDSIRNLPYDKIDKITKSIIYGKDHPMLRNINASTLAPVNAESYKEFYEHFYKPNNSYLLVMGNISHDSLISLVNKSLREWKKKEISKAEYKLVPIEEPKIVFFDTIPSGKTNIKILFPFALFPYTFDSEKTELLSVLFQDVLSEKLIKNMQLASDIDARFESDKITGNYQLNVQLTKDSINLVVQAIISAISDLKSARYTQDKLDNAKNHIINEFKKRKTTDEYLSWLIINTETSNLAKEYYPNFIEDINSIGQEQMKTFTAKYLNYNTALFQIPGKWYQSLNDFIKLCKDFRIELYQLDGKLLKVIPKGFNGFSVVNNYVEAIGGIENIKKIRDVSIKFGALYELPNEEKMFVDGEMLHKPEDRYYTESRMIRPKKDTVFLHMQIFDGANGLDSTKQGKRRLQSTELELLKYKSPFVPETQYKEWKYDAKLVLADTLNNSYVWVVVMDTPAKQRIIDYYDVDKGIRYKRIITDHAFYDQRTITYDKYQRDDNKEILYPYLKTIVSKNTTIRMIIREVDYKTRIDKKIFEFVK